MLAAGQSNFTGNFTDEGRGPAQLNESGEISVDGRLTPYLIRHLPVSSFPDLPFDIQTQLNLRGCLIPQTFEAYHPENVVHASLEHAGSSDWAVLCSAKGTVTLLVFFAGNATEPFVLASAQETERLEARTSGRTLGFDWGIDSTSPAQVHDAQSGLEPRPPLLDHDALSDSIVNHPTVYHFYGNNAWTLVDLPE